MDQPKNDNTKGFNSNQVENQDSNLKSQKKNKDTSEDELVNLFKKHNISEKNTQNTPVLDASSNLYKSKRSSTNISIPKPVPEWVLDEKAIKAADEKMINSKQLKVPIALVFDLNGTLVKRGGSKKNVMYLRPHIHEFIEFVMENFYVMSWTTAKPHNSYKIISAVFGPYTNYILCNLTRLHCKILGSYYKNSSTIKDLEIIWDNEFLMDHKSVMKTLPSPPARKEFQKIYKQEISLISHPAVRDLYLGINSNPQSLPNARPMKFDKTNTILLDDTLSKGESQPENHLLVPEYEGIRHNDTDNGLLLIKDYLQKMVSEYREEFYKCEKEGKEFKFSVQDYMKKNSFVNANPQLEVKTSN